MVGRTRVFGTLLVCAAAAGCGSGGLTDADQVLSAVVIGQVLWQADVPVAAAAVDVEAWRDSDVRPLASTTVVTSADGRYMAKLSVRSIQSSIAAITVVRARVPAEGTPSAIAEARGTRVYFKPGTPTGADYAVVNVSFATSGSSAP